MSSHVVDQEVDTKFKEKRLKNIFKWEWIERQVNDELIGRFIRKINVKGLAYCDLYQKDMKYGSRGWKIIFPGPYYI